MHNLLDNAFIEVFKYMARKVESKHMDKVEGYLTALGASVKGIHALALDPDIIVALYEVDEAAVNRSLNFLARSIQESNGRQLLKTYGDRLTSHEANMSKQGSGGDGSHSILTGFLRYFGGHAEDDTGKSTDQVSGNGSDRL